MTRTATATRQTKETQVEVTIDLDGTGVTDVSTGLPFFDHMLDQLGRHGGFDLTVHATGDLHVDGHHTVEDVAIVVGEAFRQALGDKAGVRRFASGLYPLDEALVEVALDLSGRAFAAIDLPFGEVLPLGDPPFNPEMAEPLPRVVRRLGPDHAARHPQDRRQHPPRHRGRVQGRGPLPPRRRPRRGRRRPLHQGRPVKLPVTTPSSPGFWAANCRVWHRPRVPESVVGVLR